RLRPASEHAGPHDGDPARRADALPLPARGPLPVHVRADRRPDRSGGRAHPPAAGAELRHAHRTACRDPESRPAGPPPATPLTSARLLGLVAVTGMRVGEACALDRSDVDTGTGVVTIRAGKLNKAREVPLHPTTSQALLAHGRQRDQLAPAAQTPAFFVNVRGNRLASRRVPAVVAPPRPHARI